MGALALAAADRLTERASAAAAHGGVHPAILVHLEAYPGESVERLRRVLRISQPGAVRAANTLEEAGLLERRRGRDGRTTALHLTASGRKAAREVRAGRERGIGPLLDVLDEDEQARLLPLLEKLVAALADDRPDALTVCRLCDRDACCSTAPCPLEHTNLGAAA